MDDTLRAFLNGRHVATLGTTNAHGSIHLTNVWYLLGDDGVIYMQTADWSVKARNITRTGTASLLVDARAGGRMRGASTAGHAALITEPDEVAPIRERIMSHYMSPEGMADPKVGGRMRIGDNTIIRLTPGRWRVWNVADMFKNHIQMPGYLLPLTD